MSDEALENKRVKTGLKMFGDRFPKAAKKRRVIKKWEVRIRSHKRLPRGMNIPLAFIGFLSGFLELESFARKILPPKPKRTFHERKSNYMRPR